MKEIIIALYAGLARNRNNFQRPRLSVFEIGLMNIFNWYAINYTHV